MTVEETQAINQSHLPQFYLLLCPYLLSHPTTHPAHRDCQRESESRSVCLCFGGSSLVCCLGSCLWQRFCHTAAIITVSRPAQFICSHGFVCCTKIESNQWKVRKAQMNDIHQKKEEGGWKQVRWRVRDTMPCMLKAWSTPEGLTLSPMFPSRQGSLDQWNLAQARHSIRVSMALGSKGWVLSVGFPQSLSPP